MIRTITIHDKKTKIIACFIIREFWQNYRSFKYDNSSSNKISIPFENFIAKKLQVLTECIDHYRSCFEN